MISEIPTQLDLGCGVAKHSGAFGVDVVEHPGVDLVHNLEELPWPLPSDHFTRIFCQDVIEHIADTTAFVSELHRISTSEARIYIRTPHFSSRHAYNDPTHKHVFGYYFLDHYVKADSLICPKPLFRYIQRKFVFPPFYRKTGISYLANRFPGRYEQMFCFLCPCENLQIEITPIK